MIKKQSSKLDGLKALGRPGISRQLEPESLTGGGESRRPVSKPHKVAGSVGTGDPGCKGQERLTEVGQAGVASSSVKVTAVHVRKRGRPRLGESHLTLAHTKPWSVAGMSQATWYRRQREKRNG